MSNYTAVAKSEPATPTLRQQHARRVVDAARDSNSAVTRRNYLAAWRRLSEWADREGLGAIPASPGPVTAYLAERAANGLSPASLRMDRAAIRHHHTDAGHAHPADNKDVRRVLRGLTRLAPREGRTPRQAAALTEEGLAAIRETAQLRRRGPGGRTERANKARPPRSGGYRARIGHAGLHAAALRSSRTQGGRRGVSERRVGPRHRPPLQERPGRRGHAVRWEGRCGGASGDPSPGRLPESPGLRPPFRSGRVESDRCGSQGCRAAGPFLGTLTPGRDGQ